MPLFSLIIPVYNTQSYIKECIESVLSQTFTDYECILINDGSTDNSAVICNEYKLMDNRIVMINQNNMGLSMARNNGINVSRGEYIIFLDSDDIIIDNNALSNLSDLIKTYNIDKPNIIFHSKLFTFADNNIYSNIDTMNDNIISLNIKIFLKIIKNQKSKVLLSSWTFSINREFLLKNNLFFKENIFHEDDHFICRLLCSTDFLIINHRPFYGYRKFRPGSIMNIVNSKRLLDSIIIIKDLLELSKNEYLVYKKKIYSYFYKNLWLGVFKSLIKFEDNNSIGLIKHGLRETSICLLHFTNLKHVFLYIIVYTFGISKSVKIRIQYQKIMRKLFYR